MGSAGIERKRLYRSQKQAETIKEEGVIHWVKCVWKMERISNTFIMAATSGLAGTLDGNMFYKKKMEEVKAKEVGQRC